MEPIDKLKQLTAWDALPLLSQEDLEELLALSALKDASGLAPLHEQWSPTYDINAAAVAGWLIKAGRVAATVEIDPPGSGIFTSKVFENCRTMARLYAAKRKVSLTVR